MNANAPEMRPSDASLEMLKKLIAFDTTSHLSNLDLIHFVRDYLKDLGVDSHLVHDEQGGKANLYATLGPTDRGGVALSGHTDVVPVEGQSWSSDPFAAEVRDGLLYGRGSCDMKGFIAVALAFAPRFLERDLTTPIHLVFSYDEEVGCIGVRRLIDQFKGMPVKPAACIVGEPTDMQVVTAHKGKLSIVATVTGLEAHSSQSHRGANAVEAAAEMVAYLKGKARHYRDNGPFDSGYDPPYTTVHTGILRGGTALNIVPSAAEVQFEIRHLPEDDPYAVLAEVEALAKETLLPEMRQAWDGAEIVFTERSIIPGLSMPDDDPVVTLAKACAGANATGKVAFGTEAGLFQEVGVPTVICGPGSIVQAHKPDEYVSLDQIARCERFMERLLERVRSEAV